jgi:hypothetical protein
MKQYIDANKIETIEDLLILAKFILNNANVGVEKGKVVGYEEISKLLRDDNNGTGN